MDTLLEIVQEFARRTGLRVPSSVAGTQDAGVLQMMGLLNEVCELLTDDTVWEELTREAVFVTVAGADQGSIQTLAPFGFLGVVHGTMYDRTRKVPLYGPLSPRGWQQAQAFVPTGPFYRFRFRGNKLLFSPVAEAGNTIAFEYYSNNVVYNDGDAVYKPTFTKDDDQFLLDYKLALLGLRWKWKKEKGFPYAEDYEHFVRAATNAAGRDASKPTLYLHGSPENVADPVIIVSPGSWDV